MAKETKKRVWWRYAGLVLIVVLVVLDLYSTAAHNASKSYQLFHKVSEVQKEAPWDRSTVAVVRTNTEGIPNPTDPDRLGQHITTEQVEELVRLAVEKTGGISAVVTSDDNLILIKPNWVTDATSGSGSITDYRVVQAVVKLVYEANPKAQIIVADGSGEWIDPELARKYSIKKARIVDGLAKNGYTQMIAALRHDPALPGIDVSLGDLNVPIEDTIQVHLSGGGWYQDTYWTHRLVKEADKVISVPVMKIHGTRITVSLKNNIGVGPGSRYGWAKNGLDHTPSVMDKTIVDMARVGDIDYVVVDAITALERAYTRANGSPLYRNMIVAGSDSVAVDTVCAKLMGFNPDDISYVTMAALIGMGINDLERIDVVGESFASAGYLFQKNIVHQTWLGRSKEGQSVRFWSLNVSNEALDPQIVPTPGMTGWTEPLYASDDFIDISQAFSNRSGRYWYAFTNFSAPRNQKAELRVGSSTPMRVWIDGELVYEFTGATRRHVMPNDVCMIDLTAGEHQLLVETRKGTFNLTIAEPVPLNIPDPRYPDRYAGTRVHGLKFHL